MGALWAAVLFLTGSVVADVASTRVMLDRCPTCREANPILAPVLEHRLVAAAVIGGGNGALVGVTIWLRPKTRHWWIVPVTAGALHLAAAAWNSHLAAKR